MKREPTAVTKKDNERTNFKNADKAEFLIPET
jgi:hypothetical protein